MDKEPYHGAYSSLMAAGHSDHDLVTQGTRARPHPCDLSPLLADLFVPCHPSAPWVSCSTQMSTHLIFLQQEHLGKAQLFPLLKAIFNTPDN